jgi:hypothetical protein
LLAIEDFGGPSIVVSMAIEDGGAAQAQGGALPMGTMVAAGTAPLALLGALLIGLLLWRRWFRKTGIERTDVEVTTLPLTMDVSHWADDAVPTWDGCYDDTERIFL